MAISSRDYHFFMPRRLRGQTPIWGLTPVLLTVLIWALTPLGLAAPMGLPDEVKEALHQAGIPLQSVAIVVQEVSAPASKIKWNEKIALNPASLMKLVTTYSAIRALGPTATWRTEIRGPEPVNGMITGDVVVVGGGRRRGHAVDNWGVTYIAISLRHLVSYPVFP